MTDENTLREEDERLTELIVKLIEVAYDHGAAGLLARDDDAEWEKVRAFLARCEGKEGDDGQAPR